MNGILCRSRNGRKAYNKSVNLGWIRAANKRFFCLKKVNLKIVALFKALIRKMTPWLRNTRATQNYVNNRSLVLPFFFFVQGYLTIIPRAGMGSESIAYEAEGRMGY